MCYGTDRVLQHTEDKETAIAAFPNTMAQLCGVEAEAVAPEEIFADAFPMAYREDTKGTVRLPLKKTLSDQVLVIRFTIDRADDRQVLIDINGMTNNLSSWYAPYPNEHYDFTYVLSDAEGLKALDITMSKSRYTLKNLQVYTMDIPKASAQDITVPKLDETFQADGHALFAGEMTMEQDGYFVTTYPYKAGYQVKVDGEAVEPERVNTAFLGFPLDAGTHRIEIMFTAPGFLQGAAVSLLSLAGVLLTQCFVLWRERKREQ